ncbi:AIPR family protein [Haloglycomyces albus]|uniref:AIPR family protein n=1 Tax=Haloglycomyces albus TaxID=526067 RepID=UPI00046CE481|nr:AIPR family protein [Haloglycomyces albus]
MAMNPTIRPDFAEFCDSYESLSTWSEPARFEAFAFASVLPRFYLDEFDPSAFVIGDGSDHGSDAVAILVGGELFSDFEEALKTVESRKEISLHIVAVQAKTSPSFSDQQLNHFRTRCLNLFNSHRELPANTHPKLKTLKQILSFLGDNPRRLSRQIKVTIAYATTGERVSEEIRRDAKAFEDDLGALNYDASVETVSRAALSRGYQRLKRVSTASLPIVGREFTKLPPMPGIAKVYTAYVPAQTFVSDILSSDDGSLRESIFDENVRIFYGYKNDVNQEIRDTLRDPDKKQRFPVLNSGVTIIATSVNEGSGAFDLTYPQIVDGSQTSHVLHHERCQLSDVYLRVTLAEVDNVYHIDEIISGLNSQTAVAPEYVAARADVHEAIEAVFRSHQSNDRNIFYERKDGRYRDLPSARVFTPNRLTRAFVATFLRKPRAAVRAQAQFENYGSRVFDLNVSPHLHFAAASIAYRIDYFLEREKIQSIYRPLRWYLMSGVKELLFGNQHSFQIGKKSRKEFDRNLSAIWDDHDLQSMLEQVLIVIEEHLDVMNLDNKQLRQFAMRKSFQRNFLEDFAPYHEPLRH